MRNSVTVSILIPIYNVEKYIKSCAESLFSQTYHDIEYIFVDDCSPDKSIDVLKQVAELYPHRRGCLKIIRHNENRGLAAARNTALENCTGECIMFLDSDDTLERTAVEDCVKKYNEGYDLVVFGMNYIFNNGRKIRRFIPPIDNDPNTYLRDILYRNVAVNVCGTLINKSIFIKHNLRFIEGIDYGEDYVTIPRIVSFASSIGDLTKSYLYNYSQMNLHAYTSKALGEKQVRSIVRAVDILEKFFQALNGQFRNIDFNLVKLRNKLFLLEYCDSSSLEIVDKLYSDIPKRNLYSEISGKHLIVWRLYCALPLMGFKICMMGLRKFYRVCRI